MVSVEFNFIAAVPPLAKVPSTRGVVMSVVFWIINRSLNRFETPAVWPR